MFKLAPRHAQGVNRGIGLKKYCILVFYKIWAVKDEQIFNRVAKWTLAPVLFHPLREYGVKEKKGRR